MQGIGDLDRNTLLELGTAGVAHTTRASLDGSLVETAKLDILATSLIV